MIKGILGRKVGMTQVYDEKGRIVPVTVIQAGPCRVLQLKTAESKEKYEAVQLGFLDKPRRLATQSERGRAKVADCEPQRFVREFRGSTDGYEVGQQLTVDILADVASVDVTGTSKGRGFSGVMKRHGFAGQRATHGVKKVHRHAGGTGCSAAPSRVFKGRRMAGQFGNTRVTTRNLQVVKVDSENNLLVVRGAVPGPNGGYLIVKATNKF